MFEPIEQFIDEQQDWYDKYATKNKRYHTIITISKLVISTCIPIISLSITELSWANYTVAILGAIIAVLTGLQASFRFKDNWIKFRHTSYNLRFEKLLYKNSAPPYGKNERKFEAIRHIKEIMDSEHIQWFEVNSKDPESPSH